MPDWNQFSTPIPVSKGGRRNAEELCRFLYCQVIAKIRHNLKKLSRVVKFCKTYVTLSQGVSGRRNENSSCAPHSTEDALPL
jgi:hypothetical protein